MGNNVFVGERGPQHPFYGLSRENIAPRLTRRNWKIKALWKRSKDGEVYIFIERGVEASDSGREQTLYCVSVYGDAVDRFPQKDCPRFARLQEALGYANGEGDSPLPNATEQADPDLLPERGTPLGIVFPRPERTDGMVGEPAAAESAESDLRDKVRRAKDFIRGVRVARQQETDSVGPTRLPPDTDPTKLEACRAYARMMNTLNPAHIESWLAEDVKYNSQWVMAEMVGKHQYMEYITGKIQTIKATGSRVWAEIAYTHAFGSGPCVVLAQETPENLKATLLIDMTGDKICSMCMCCVPSPYECRRTGEQPTDQEAEPED